MKILVFTLVLAISAQPLQAGFCAMDMGKNQESPHHVDGAADTGHDCCDTSDAEALQEQGCDGDTHCAPCFVSAQALPTTARLQLNLTPQRTESALPDLVPSSHFSPPFRPPIC